MAESPLSSSTPSVVIHGALMDSAISINIPISTKLSDSNFPTWQTQLLPLIHGYNLSRFIDSSPPPLTRSNVTSGAIEANPEYFPWHRQDQLLLGWIRSSLTDLTQAEVISCTTTRELWLTLKNNYTSTARSRITSLKRQIQSAQKGSQSCSQYLTSLRRLADELAFIGSPVPDDDLVNYAVNGLGTEFNSVVAAVHALSHHDPFSFSDLKALILAHEALLKTQEEPASAFYTGRDQAKTRSPLQNITQNSESALNSDSHQVYQSPKPNFSQNSGSTQFSSSGTKPTCQICFQSGHTGKVCYKRYNQYSDWKPPPPRSTSNARAFNVQAFSAHTHPGGANTSSWLLDPGGNNHVTNDLNNLSAFFNYDGSDKLQVGNGIGLPIAHIGSTTLQLFSSSIVLLNVLHVPNFFTNLISLSQLLKDNPHLGINFYSSHCLFKELHTRTDLHQVHNANVLYPLQLASSP